MINKILSVSVLASLFFAGNVYAVGQAGNVSGIGQQTLQQSQTVNQGEENQIQTQNNEQFRAGTQGVGVQEQQKVQQKLQDGGKNAGQAQKENNGGQEKGKTVSEQRRSQVANAVQEMVKLAERNQGIGQEVKEIAQNQNQNHGNLEDILQKIQNRNAFAKFFMGPNYGEIKNAQKMLEQNKQQIQQLSQLKNQLLNQGEAQMLEQQIKVLEQANFQIENSLQEQQKGFSLFGWAFRIFSK